MGPAYRRFQDWLGSYGSPKARFPRRSQKRFLTTSSFPISQFPSQARLACSPLALSSSAGGGTCCGSREIQNSISDHRSFVGCARLIVCPRSFPEFELRGDQPGKLSRARVGDFLSHLPTLFRDGADMLERSKPLK